MIGTEKCTHKNSRDEEKQFKEVGEGLLSAIESQNLTVKLEMAEELEAMGMTQEATLRLLLAAELQKMGMTPEAFIDQFKNAEEASK